MFNKALHILMQKCAGAVAPAAQPNTVTTADMQKFKNMTGRSDINSPRARWATREAMAGRYDFSDAAYRRAFAAGKVK